MKEALRYLNNAKEILRATPIEEGTYTDVKPLREAFGTAYLAVLEAINESLIKKGLAKKELPKSADAYRKALQKHIAIHNGKLMREFEMLYDIEDRKSNGTYFGCVHPGYGNLQPPEIGAAEVAPTHEGKIRCSFVYANLNTLHIAGYYRGLFYNVNVVNAALKAARTFIEKMG